MFCAGVNWFVFHRFAHQPWLDRKPGMAMGQWGIQYERTQTWWDFSKPWHEYLARCQLLLQAGRFGADVCYLTTESAFASPPSTEDLDPSLPPGYDYDVIHPRLFMDRMSASNGWLTLPDGMGYRVLALPPVRTMTPALLRKLRDLVAGGATVVGPPPLQSPSLADFPQADNDVKNMAKELWGDTDGHRCGTIVSAKGGWCGASRFRRSWQTSGYRPTSSNSLPFTAFPCATSIGVSATRTFTSTPTPIRIRSLPSASFA